MAREIETFAWDGWLLFPLIGYLLCLWLVKKALRPFVPKIAIPFSLFSSKRRKASWRVVFLCLPPLFYGLALASMMVALLNVRIESSKSREVPSVPSEGAIIYLLLDRSKSMGEEVVPTMGATDALRKIDLLKKFSKDFILGNEKLGLAGRKSDLLGLVLFSRGAQVAVPLTMDHEKLVQELEQLEPLELKGQEGTAIGHAIYKGASLISATRHFAQRAEERFGQLKSPVMIVVTDGLQDPNPLDAGKRWRTIEVEEAARFAASEGIRLYIVNIDDKLNEDTFGAHRRLMSLAAELTGGRFFTVGQKEGLAQIYREIDQLEKSSWAPAPLVEQLSPSMVFYYYPYFLTVSLLALLSGLLLESSWLRKVP